MSFNPVFQRVETLSQPSQSKGQKSSESFLWEIFKKQNIYQSFN